MSRSDHFVGLSLRGMDFVDEMDYEEYDTLKGAFYTTFPLYRYTRGNEEFFEVLQADPWSSGPWFMTTLRDHPELDWTDEEIEEYSR